MTKRHFLLSSFASVLLFAGLANAQSKQYLILGNGQGKGSTGFASQVNANGGLVVANLETIGVVTATSDNPNFAAAMKGVAGVQNVADDTPVQWINNEQVADASQINPTGQSLNAEPFSAYQWNMRQIHADQSAALGFQGQGARVAVLDAGMFVAHPDLAPNVDVAHAVSFVPTEPSVVPTTPTAFNHGTHVGGIIAAAINNKGTQGVAPQAQLVPIKVLSQSGSGSFSWLLQGLAYAETVNVDVANMSLGATFLRNPNADPSCVATYSVKDCNAGTLMAALNRSINHATQAGILCVIAAGNSGLDLNGDYVSIPAQSGNGMAVSATGPVNLADFDRLASYSNYGQSVVDVAAPGGDAVSASGYPFDMVLSPGSATGYFFAAGTSMAAPHVAGEAAVLVGAYGHVGPAKLKNLIENSAVDILKPGADAATGKGRVDVMKALGY